MKEGSIENCTFVIFGAAGDLAGRKIYPSLYHLARSKLLPKDFQVIGFSRKNLGDEKFRDIVHESLVEQVGKDLDEGLSKELLSRFKFLQGDGADSGTYEKLKKSVKGNCLFYLATPPGLFGKISVGLADAGLVDESQGWRRIVIEKPFGRDLESARSLNKKLGSVLSENQIYRIDHYLGKETVQNILVFRFANGIFEPIWNRSYIDSIQITVAETLGVEKRAEYYEQSGALRDMVSSHLLQLVSLIGMEPPNSLSGDDVRNETVKVLNAVKVYPPEEAAQNAVRGQYGAGTIDGKRVTPYQASPGVDPHSAVDTFAAVKFEVDNWRWAGVPFYLRTGKSMAKHVTEIAIQFKCAPFQLFKGVQQDPLTSNFLVMHIYPDEGITLSITAKVPGPETELKTVEMKFNYTDYFGSDPSTGYETLIYDCIRGDNTLFRRADQVERAWEVLMPILNAWSSQPPQGFPNYPAGSWGPKEAEELLRRDGREWREVQ